MNPKYLSLIHMILLVTHLFFHPKNMDKSYGSILLKLLINMKQIQHNTLVTPSSYVLLMIINTKRFFHTTKLSITLQTKRMKILYENSNILLPMREHLTNPLPITNNHILMWWLNGKQRRLPLSPFTALHHMTPLYVIYVLTRWMCYKSRDGNNSAP